jgi:DNA modification methylase
LPALIGAAAQGMEMPSAEARSSGNARPVAGESSLRRDRSGRGSKPGSQSPRLEIAYRPIGELKLDPRNPRHHSRKQIRQLVHSIETFGFTVPALVDGAGNVIAGHGRILACRELGWLEIPTISIDHLSEARRHALLVADNRLAETASWDERLLAEQLRDLSLADLDFSIEAIGFEMGEIDLRIAALEGEPAQDEPADGIEPGTTPPVSKPGDLWLLDQHRILCGSILDIAALQHLMGEQRAAMVFADPPYNVPIDGHATGLGSIHHRPFAMATGEMTLPAFAVFLAASLRNHAAFSRAGALLYLCMDWRHMTEVLAAGRDIDAEPQNLCVWVKDNGGMGSLYRSQHELVFVFRTGPGPHRNNVQLGRFGRNRANVWHYPGINSFSRNTEEGDLLALHPTVKPVALVADAILDCTARGEIVLDGFLGSGTTVIAAERTGRRCFGVELDPAYVDTIIRRWQRLSGGSARHAASGRNFDDIAQDLEAPRAG